MLKTVCSLALATVALTSPAQSQAILGGAKASVELSIGVKGADRQPDVDFEVIQPDGGRATATAKAPYGGERPGSVTYPGDFGNAGMHSGTYRWVARANGRQLAAGTFRYVPVKGALQVVTPY